MGSHAYCNVIFGVPVGSNILITAAEEEDEFLIEDLLAESDTDFQEFRQGHSAYECTYYIGIPICSVSLSDRTGKVLDEFLVKSNSDRDFYRDKSVELIRLMEKYSLHINPYDIDVYLVIAFDE